MERPANIEELKAQASEKFGVEIVNIRELDTEAEVLASRTLLLLMCRWRTLPPLKRIPLSSPLLLQTRKSSINFLGVTDFRINLARHLQSVYIRFLVSSFATRFGGGPPHCQYSLHNSLLVCILRPQLLTRLSECLSFHPNRSNRSRYSIFLYVTCIRGQPL